VPQLNHQLVALLSNCWTTKRRFFEQITQYRVEHAGYTRFILIFDRRHFSKAMSSFLVSNFCFNCYSIMFIVFRQADPLYTFMISSVIVAQVIGSLYNTWMQLRINHGLTSSARYLIALLNKMDRFNRADH